MAVNIPTIGGAATEFGLGKVSSRLAWSRTKRMMQNRHQWEVADLRAAGLNPILSAGGTPSMGQPSMQPTPNVAAHRKVSVDKRQNQAQRGLMRDQRWLLGQQGAAQAAAAEQSRAGAAKHRSEAGYIDTQNRLAGFGMARAALESEVAGTQSARVAAYMNQFGPLMNTILQGVGAAGVWRLGGGGAWKSPRVQNLNLNKGNRRTPLSPTGAPTRTGLNPKFKDGRNL